MFYDLFHLVVFVLLFAMVLCIIVGVSTDSWSFERLMRVLQDCPDVYTPVVEWAQTTISDDFQQIINDLPDNANGIEFVEFLLGLVDSLLLFIRFGIYGFAFVAQILFFIFYFFRLFFIFA